MENCFRFLINVDQCLNMSNFDIFFYKLESQHKFHLNQVQLFGDSPDSSLHSAIDNIRMYLDKYPYHVGDFQIIVTMRGAFHKDPTDWEQTLLYRLLQLDHYLRQARIFFNSREHVDKALNLIMLYDVDFSKTLPKLERYMISTRFQHDCKLLLRHLGMEDMESETMDLTPVLEAYATSDHCDPAAKELAYRFQTFRTAAVSVPDSPDTAPLEPEEAEGTLVSAKPIHDPLLAQFAMFLKDQLFNFQVFEAQIDRNNRRQNTLALLRVVDFINMSVEPTVGVDGKPTNLSLLRRCANNWEKAFSDPGLEQRYSAMLYFYQQRLKHVANSLEDPRFTNSKAQALPQQNTPSANAIASSETIFSSNKPEDQGKDLKAKLKKYLSTRHGTGSLVPQWESLYASIKNSLNRMEHELKLYAEDLSRQYATILDKRKKETLTWQNQFYLADEHTEKNISQVGQEREELLEQLKSPHMTPSLSYQDQLNMENSLEQANLSIRFYLHCMSMTTVGNFLLLLLSCAGLFVLHYTVLQPYALQSMDTLLCYLLYILAVVVLMTFAYHMPYQHFRRKLKKAIEDLQDDMDKYIRGYFEKADHFARYINLLNRLDSLTRYYRLLQRAYRSTHRLSQGYLWHKIQVQNHLNKLNYFQGLIDLCTEAGEIPENAKSLPEVDGDRVKDVVDSPVYWPQS